MILIDNIYLIVREDRRAVSTASKALLGQRRRGQSLDLLAKGAGWRWGAVSGSFILRSAQQEEALHRICNKRKLTTIIRRPNVDFFLSFICEV
ncbi:unnamed protein product [Spirodela intermedia]|uniref:Uncharacterized protein n=1 Tax=Spirodela intermedia TaxID=51605 RepID=A0ABN7EAP7_SPIIN|nr:unnamed protein product [Spirodela intermedia]